MLLKKVLIQHKTLFRELLENSMIGWRMTKSHFNYYKIYARGCKKPFYRSYTMFYIVLSTQFKRITTFYPLPSQFWNIKTTSWYFSPERKTILINYLSWIGKEKLCIISKNNTIIKT